MFETEIAGARSDATDEAGRGLRAAPPPAAPPPASDSVAQTMAQTAPAAAQHQVIRTRMRATPQLKWAQNAPMLLPLDNPQFLVYVDAIWKQLIFFSLAERDPILRPVVSFAEGATTQAASGDSVGLGIGRGRLLVYDICTLVAAAEAGPQITLTEQEVPPRAQGMCTQGTAVCVGLAFSADGGRLFAIAKGGSGVTVHNVKHEDLPVVQVLPFIVGHGLYSDYRLAATDNLVVASGGGSSLTDGGPAARLVQAWQVDNGAVPDDDGDDDVHHHEVPDDDGKWMKPWWTHSFESVAESVAMCARARLLAVGLRDGTVEVFSTASVPWELQTKIPRIADETNSTQSTDQPVFSLQYNHDGTKLAAGRVGVTRHDHFSVYDMLASGSVVNQFRQNKSMNVNSVAFLHSGGTDMLVTGSGIPGNYMLRTLHPRGVGRTLTMTPIEGSLLQPISSADLDPVSGVVALCAGSVLQLFDERGKLMLDRDFRQELRTYGLYKSAVKVQLGGGLVACGLMDGGASQVIALEAVGSEAFRITQNFGSLYEIVWSPDGQMLAIGTSRSGAVVLSATGTVIHTDGKHVSSCAFDGTGSKFVSADSSKFEVVVWDVQNWEMLHTLSSKQWIGSVALSPTGDSVAYLEGLSDADVIVWPLDPSGGKQTQRFALSINARSAFKFSDDGCFILCCPTDAEPSDPHKLRVLDLKTSAEAEWGQAMRVMGLPVAGGLLVGRALGWAEVPLQSATQPGNDSMTVTNSWALYGAVGPQFVVTDMEMARDAVEDAAWSTQQLTFISENHPELVLSIAKSAPQCVNIRDPETGDTLLHYLARTRQMHALRNWVDNGAKMTPIENSKGQTALMVALEMEQSDIARLLWSNMANTLSFISASLISEELRVLSTNHTNLVGPFLNDIQPVITQTVAMFRTELIRQAEVCGLPTPTIATIDESEDGTSVMSIQNTVPAVWADRLPIDKPKMLVASKVVLVPNLLGDRKNSPFHDIVNNCDSSVFESSLLEWIVQYKWDTNVKSLRLWAFITYLIAFTIGSAAMLSSTSGLQDSEPARTVDLLQGSMIALELVTLGSKIFRLAREGALVYLTGFWNLLSCAASACLLVAGASHFFGWLVGVRTVGSLGVGMKCFGLVDHLRSFAGTASLVRMVSVIMVDMAPFMTILGTVVIGSTLVFAINSPFSAEFAFMLDDDRVDPFHPLLTVFQMMLNVGNGVNVDSSTPWPTLVTMLFFMGFVIVVLCAKLLSFHTEQLNMLIAIMADSYEKVKENERVEALRERAQIIVESERTIPSSHCYQKYMHIVQATNSTNAAGHLEWEGITGRVKQLLELQDERLKQFLRDEVRAALRQAQTQW